MLSKPLCRVLPPLAAELWLLTWLLDPTTATIKKPPQLETRCCWLQIHAVPSVVHTCEASDRTLGLLP
jgi:hypothetical protein